MRWLLMVRGTIGTLSSFGCRECAAVQERCTARRQEHLAAACLPSIAAFPRLMRQQTGTRWFIYPRLVPFVLSRCIDLPSKLDCSVHTAPHAPYRTSFIYVILKNVRTLRGYIRGRIERCSKSYNQVDSRKKKCTILIMSVRSNPIIQGNNIKRRILV